MTFSGLSNQLPPITALKDHFELYCMLIKYVKRLELHFLIAIVGCWTILEVGMGLLFWAGGEGKISLASPVALVASFQSIFEHSKETWTIELSTVYRPLRVTCKSTNLKELRRSQPRCVLGNFQSHFRGSSTSKPIQFLLYTFSYSFSISKEERRTPFLTQSFARSVETYRIPTTVDSGPQRIKRARNSSHSIRRTA